MNSFTFCSGFRQVESLIRPTYFLWSHWLAPDEENRIEPACRCLLARDRGGKTVLYENGIETFIEPKLKSRYGILCTSYSWP